MTKEISMTVDEEIKRKANEENKEESLKPTQLHKKRYYFHHYPSKDTRRRIRIENLNKELNNSDLKNLFSKYGKLLRCGIYFDKMGDSTGKADVEFSTHEECEAAIKELDNYDLSGEKLRVKYFSSLIRRSFRKIRNNRKMFKINRRKGTPLSMKGSRKRFLRRSGLKKNKRLVVIKRRSGVNFRRRLIKRSLGERR